MQFTDATLKGTGAVAKGTRSQKGYHRIVTGILTVYVMMTGKVNPHHLPGAVPAASGHTQ